MNLNQCADLVLKGLGPVLQERFAGNPLEVLQGDLHLTVRAVDHLGAHRDGGGACDGVSFLEDNVVLYASTPNSRRENFTLAHELGHWLVERTPDAVNWLADHHEPDRMIEALCDRIAQRLLLSPGTLNQVIGSGPVRSTHIRDLYNTSQASEPVCAIALAARLPGLGAALIVERTSWMVEYATVRPDTRDGWPSVFPWPKYPVPAGHPLKTMAPGSSLITKTFWRSPWGRTQSYYMDAVSGQNRVHAILCAVDVWGASEFHANEPREFDRRPTTEIYCCGRTRVVRGWLCHSCNEPDCPACGHCRCQRHVLREQACRGCFQLRLPHLLSNGVCEDCL